MRSPIAFAAGALALALAGCGGGGGAGTSPAGTETAEPPAAALVVAGLEPPGGCYVTVFLLEDVTKAQIASVQRQLLASKAIIQVSFVSKSLQFRRFATLDPTAAKGMHVNPFTDRFEVVPRTRGGAFSIIGDFAVKGGPITNVKQSTGCTGPA
jgi:hypothetical protein